MAKPNTNPIENPGETMIVTMVPLKNIVADIKFNARKMEKTDKIVEKLTAEKKKGEEKPEVLEGEGQRPQNATDAKDTPGIGGDGTSIASLARAIKAEGGLQNPLLVRDLGTGKYQLIAGFRRFAAVTLLGWETVPCNVRKYADDKAAMLANLIENVQREDLSPGEIADRALLLASEFKMEGSEIAGSVGLSKSYINNLMRLATKLHPKLWDMARSGTNNQCPPQSKLLKWAAEEDHDAQWESYQKWLDPNYGKTTEGEGADGEGSGGDGDGSGGGEETGPEYKAPSRPKLMALLKGIKHAKKTGAKSDDWCEGALAVVRYAIGKVGANGNPPKMPVTPPEEGGEEE